ncbi:MAG: hypothetical protein KF855_15430 [Acidobacteria bacterium]|nr:hypothetical protein [Acidobacteriota bacterium]
MRFLKKAGFVLPAAFFALFLFSATEAQAQRETFHWTGTVDQDVQIVIRGRRATVRTMRGQRYNDARYNFNGRSMGNRRRDADVDKHDGRGKVRVIQQPSRRNNYTTIIRVEDPKGEPDRYSFTVKWDD